MITVRRARVSGTGGGRPCRLLEGRTRAAVGGTSLLLALALVVWLDPLAHACPTFKDCTAQLGLALSTDAACWVDIDNDG